MASFDESRPLVARPDETNEVQNRRVEVLMFGPDMLKWMRPTDPATSC